jgi:RNA polymerase sigma factor for flagellar operon FliA
VILTAYWRWECFVRPAPVHLAKVLAAVRDWVVGRPPDWAPVRSVLATELRPLRAEAVGQPRVAVLLDACLQLDDHSLVPDDTALGALQLALIEQFQGLPRGIARQTWETAPARLELDELVAIANEALVVAARRWPDYCVRHNYNPTAPYFQWYATQRIRGALIDSFRAADWVTRTQRGHARALLNAGQETGASVRELADRTGLSPQAVAATQLAIAQAPVSLEAQVVDVGDAGHPVESHLLATELLDTCVRAIDGLHQDAQSVLVLKYYTNLSLDDIAQTVGLPKTAVPRLHIDAVLAVHAAMTAAAHEALE